MIGDFPAVSRRAYTLLSAIKETHQIRRTRLPFAINLQCLRAHHATQPWVDDEPIFVLAAGWRSGSTLLQRLLISSGEALIWGEPFHYCDLIPRLVDSWRAFSPTYPTPNWAPRTEPPEHLSRSWIAILSPTPEDLVMAHQSLLHRLLCEPASHLGYQRWGLKQVRFGEDEARYLKFLFPRSRLIFLVRNPRDCFRSHRASTGHARRNVTWAPYPERPIFTARQFGVLWSRLAAGFHRSAAELGALSVRYEDLILRPGTLSAIADYTGLQIDSSVLETRVNGLPPDHPAKEFRLSSLETRILDRVTADVAALYGYHN